jgi:autotransporter-associated beta strand protein
VTLNGTLLPALVTVNNTSNPYTFSGTGSIAGEASLVKNGAGALTLATANTYTGGTTLNAGTLNLNNASALGTGTLTINGGTLDNTSGDAIVMTGNFPQLWNADINFTGTSSLDMGAGGVSMADTVLTDRTVTVAANTLGVGEITSALGLTKQGPGTLVVASMGVQANSSLIGGALNVAAGTLQINRTGVDAANSGDFTATAISGGGTITNGAAVERWVFINTTGANTFSGTLANGGTGGLGFAKQGTGSITLNGTLSYTGTTTVDAGTLTIPVVNTGTGTGAVVNGGFLVLGNPAALGTPAVPATPNIIRVGGTATLDLAHDGGGPTYGFASNTAANAVIIANRATAGAGINHTLTTVGNAGVSGGTLTFNSGANATSGTSRVSFTQLGLAADTVQTTILNPTNADPAATAVTIGAVTKVAGTTTQTLELGGTTTDNHITGLISNGTATAGTNLGVAISKTNSSTWTISGANNTYTGGTRIGTANGAGVLRVTATGALGTGGIFFDGFGGNPGPTSRLELSSGTGITLANAITLNQRNNATAAILNVTGNNILSGTIDLQIGGNRANIQSDAGQLTLSGPILTTTAVARNLYLGGAGNGVASGSISNGTGTLNLFKEGAGTWTLTSASNIYTGTTTVSGGTLSMSNATLSDIAALTVAGTAFLNLTHNATDTVDRFFIDGVEQASGTWGSLTSSATNKTARITGTGIINATNGVTPPASGFGNWASLLGLTAGNNGVGDNPDNDGFDNGLEYILGGHPNNGSNNPKVYTLTTDSSDAGTTNELVMTIAVPQGTPAFTAGTVGTPASTATFEGFGITVHGSTDLASFPVIVTPVTTIIPAGAPNPLVQGGVTYEYRTFSLEGSNGLAGKGFLQVSVTNPAP